MPSLVIAIRPLVAAMPHRLFSTMSKRIRGEAPYAVALRRKVGENSAVASAATSRSTSVLHTA